MGELLVLLVTATEAKVVATNGGLLETGTLMEEMTFCWGWDVTMRAVLTMVEPTIGDELSGRMAMIFLPPEPVIKTNCLPVAWREAANAGGTMICRKMGLLLPAAEEACC